MGLARLAPLAAMRGFGPAAYPAIEEIAGRGHRRDSQPQHDKAQRPARRARQRLHGDARADLDAQDNEGDIPERIRHPKLYTGQHGANAGNHAAREPGRGEMNDGEDGAAGGADGKREKEADQNKGLRDENSRRYRS